MHLQWDRAQFIQAESRVSLGKLKAGLKEMCSYREGTLGRQQLHVNFLKLRKCMVLSYLDALPATGTGSECSPKAVHVTSQTSHPDSLKSCSKISPFFRYLQHCAHPCQQGAAFWHLLHSALLCHFTAFCAPLHSSLS